MLKTDNRKKEGTNIDEERSGKKKGFVSVNKNALVRKNMVIETLLSYIFVNVIFAIAFLKVNVKNNHAYKKQLIKNQICLL